LAQGDPHGLTRGDLNGTRDPVPARGPGFKSRPRRHVYVGGCPAVEL